MLRKLIQAPILIMLHTEPVERPPVPPGQGGSLMLRDLVLRDVALLLINRLKKNIFLVNVPLKWLPPEAFSAQNALSFGGRALPGPAGGGLQRSPDP